MRTRDLSRLVLATTLNIASAFDYWSTKRALEKGLREGNPVARSIMRMGWRKYQLTKFSVPLIWAYLGVASPDPADAWKASMAVGIMLFIFATVNNLLIARRY